MEKEKEKDTYRPVIRPILAVYTVAYLLIVAVSGLLLLELPFPSSFIYYPAWVVIALVFFIVIAAAVSRAAWRHFTETYSIEDGRVIRIQRGWASRTSAVIPFQNIAEAKAVMPLALRLFHVGTVFLSTNDGFTHVLYNVRYPEGLVETIKPAFLTGIDRPSVG